MLSRYRDRLGANLWLFGDGPVHQSRRQQIVFGARGVLPVQFTITAPSAGSTAALWELDLQPDRPRLDPCRQMRDDEGQIKIACFADDVVPIEQPGTRSIEAAPAIEAALEDELQVARHRGRRRPSRRARDASRR